MVLVSWVVWGLLDKELQVWLVASTVGLQAEVMEIVILTTQALMQHMVWTISFIRVSNHRPLMIIYLLKLFLSNNLQINSRLRQYTIKNSKSILKFKNHHATIKRTNNQKKKRIRQIISYLCRILQTIISSLQTLVTRKRCLQIKKKKPRIAWLQAKFLWRP